MKWKIEFDEKAKKELLTLDKQTQKRIVQYLDKHILTQNNPNARLLISKLKHFDN